MANETNSTQAENTNWFKNIPPAYLCGIVGSIVFIAILFGVPWARDNTAYEWVKAENFNVGVFLLAILVFTGKELTELYAEAFSSSKNFSDLGNKIREVWEMQGGKLTGFDKCILILIHLIIYSPFVFFFICPDVKNLLKIEDFSVFVKGGAYYYPILVAFLIAKFGFVPFLKYEEPKSNETIQSAQPQDDNHKVKSGVEQEPKADSDVEESAESTDKNESEITQSDNLDNQNKA